ncbi:MAG: hypothetical protein R2706_02160 [Acidimicrobiales bacterium]
MRRRSLSPEATAVGGRSVLVEAGGLSASLLAAHSVTPYWMVAPVGRVLPASYTQEMALLAASQAGLLVGAV